VLTLIDLDRDHRVPYQVPEINASSVGAITPEVHGRVVYERVAVPPDECVAHCQFARFRAYVCCAWICREHASETIRAIAIVTGRRAGAAMLRETPRVRDVDEAKRFAMRRAVRSFTRLGVAEKRLFLTPIDRAPFVHDVNIA